MSVYCFHKLHVVPSPLLKHVIHWESFCCEDGLTWSCISAAMCVVLPPGAAHKSRILSPGWGSRTWVTTADGKFYKKKNQLSKILNHFNFRIREHKETIGSNPVQHPPPRPRVFFFYIYKYTGIRKITIS